MLRRTVFVLAVVLAGAVVMIGGSSSSPPAEAQSCSAAYPDFCIPPTPDVNCDDAVIAGRKNFTALDPDPHRLDADNDGVACEDPNQPRFPTTTTTVAPVTTTTVAGDTRIITITPAPAIAPGVLDRTG